MVLKVYGCRGSAPVSRPGGSAYGANTSCIQLTSGDESLVLDAGSGIMVLRDELCKQEPKLINILNSHLHLDHVIGLGTFDPVWNKKPGVRFYTISRDKRPIKEQIGDLYSPPFWPVSLADSDAFEVVEIKEEVSFKIGVFTVTPFDVWVMANDGDRSLITLITCDYRTDPMGRFIVRGELIP